MALSRISIALPDIIRYFDSYDERVLRRRDLASIFNEQREFWRLTQSMRLSEFIAYLVSNTKLRKVVFKLPHRRETRYCWGEVSRYKLAVSMKSEGYLSHYSAVALHGLTLQVPKTIYVNHEQRPQTPSPGGLTQERIDAAFRRPQRRTNNFTEYKGYRYCYVNGKHTGRLGVVEMEDELGDKVPVTGLERTLIDITTRPMYGGGIPEVLEAYIRAREDISLNRLAAILTKMNYIYPYGQAVGYLLERSGYSIESIERHRAFRLSPDGFNFYLAHDMKDVEYVQRWRLFIPKGL